MQFFVLILDFSNRAVSIHNVDVGLVSHFDVGCQSPSVFIFELLEGFIPFAEVGVFIHHRFVIVLRCKQFIFQITAPLGLVL